MNDNILNALQDLTATVYQLNSLDGFEIILEFQGFVNCFNLRIYPKNHKDYKTNIYLTGHVEPLTTDNIKAAHSALIEAYKRCVTGESLSDLDKLAKGD